MLDLLSQMVHSAGENLIPLLRNLGRKPVTVHHEEVEVERRPATGRARDRDIGDEDVRIPIREEEVVVEKRPRVKEEIVVKKRDVEETRTVDADVRKERVDVERVDDEQSRRR